LYTRIAIRFGYPTQNLTIPASTNRTLRLASLSNVEKVRELVRENVADLKTVLRWNTYYGVGLFRIGQNPIPFAKGHALVPMDVEIE
jgi:UV DNA damage endonuclease